MLGIGHFFLLFRLHLLGNLRLCLGSRQFPELADLLDLESCQLIACLDRLHVSFRFIEQVTQVIPQFAAFFHIL